MYRVDITADLNDEDDTGYVWTFLDEARDPGQDQARRSGRRRGRGRRRGMPGDRSSASWWRHNRPPQDLPGLVDDYRALVQRALAS